ncbi:MAG: DNA methylase [Bacteroidales bacterium]|nr:DNA methylase [Bacteroidales bacterium]
MDDSRQYIAIDLKSFYASVECVERGLNPLTTNLVVADKSRTEKTICLAVSPSLKAYGIGGRARLFEVVQRVREVNAGRQFHASGFRFSGKSCDDLELKANPDLALDYIAAKPRMSFYIEYSTRIYSQYLKFVAPEDIHVYSIDEVFIDATDYLRLYKTTAHDLARKMISAVLDNTGITATAGIGTNMYLAKVAMDIVAKHIPADKDGVRIAELDEMTYRKTLWNHRPLTDFWRLGRGIAKRLEHNEIYTMGMLARCSVENEELLYKLFGVNAELLIDHAWGWEPCTMEMIKKYRPEANSLSQSQVLQCAYTSDKARLVTHEMADNAALGLVEKRLVAHSLTLTINYDVENLLNTWIKDKYKGDVVVDFYGRMAPKPAHGSVCLPFATSSSKMIIDSILGLYDKIVNPLLLVRRITIGIIDVVPEKDCAVTPIPKPYQLDLFTDYESMKSELQKQKDEIVRERKMQEAILAIKSRYGKNSILKGLNFEEGATAKDRNRQIGGHRE